ncbi:dynamin family protein [bacterium]|nr:dynamin family protein [bacterium]
MARLITRLSARLDERFSPVLSSLDEGVAGLRGFGADAGARALADGLANLRGDVETLRAKIAAQHSYVLLFGPLKSGKSTLMNALSGAYVSEVTSLPAYPCMVYVGHGDRVEVVTTRWDGSTERTGDLDSIRSSLALAHGELARAIREAETRGDEFDPAIHLPRAIRRIDVRLPAPELRESGTMLVDTPGLYTKMRFGYDHLTREFKLASASAIFVVKTDNLFLEQVFAEFEDLLRLFTRIFLVVNLDTNKRDLEPGGQLGPSLERRDPGQILAAFEDLAMSPTLRRARDEGRLSIYPIDLLHAASARLRDAGAPAVEPVPGVDGLSGAEAFERFRADLSSYLNSHEAMHLFVRDTLRQSRRVLDGVSGLASGEGRRVADALVGDAEAEHRRWVARAAAAGRLRLASLESGLEPSREPVLEATREASAEARRRAGERIDEVLDRWFESDRSLSQLLGEDLVPALDACREDLSWVARDAARAVVGGEAALANLLGVAAADFATVKMPLAEVVREGLSTTPPIPSGKSAIVSVPTGLVPVRRSLLDWLLLRGPVRMRRALFGPEESPTRPVPVVVKQRRLGAAARSALGSALHVRLDRFFADALSQSAISAFGASATDAVASVRGAIDREVDRAAAGVETSQAAIASRTALREGLARLAGRSVDAASGIEDLVSEMGVPAAPPAAAASTGDDAGKVVSGDPEA